MPRQINAAVRLTECIEASEEVDELDGLVGSYDDLPIRKLGFQFALKHSYLSGQYELPALYLVLYLFGYELGYAACGEPASVIRKLMGTPLRSISPDTTK